MWQFVAVAMLPTGNNPGLPVWRIPARRIPARRIPAWRIPGVG